MCLNRQPEAEEMKVVPLLAQQCRGWDSCTSSGECGLLVHTSLKRFTWVSGKPRAPAGT